MEEEFLNDWNGTSLNSTLLVTIVKYTQIHLEEQAQKPVTRIPF